MPSDNGDNDESQQGNPKWGQVIRSQGGTYWTQLAEQRLNDLGRQVRDVKTDLSRLQEKQGSAEGASHENGWGIKRLEEMMREMEKTLARMEGLIPDKRRAELVEKIVFGLVGLILIAVVGLWLKTIGIGTGR